MTMRLLANRFRRGWDQGYTMVKRNIGPLSSEDNYLTNLRNLVGTENILAECNGVNYQVYVTESRLLVGKRFSPGEHYVNVPASRVHTLELITKSLLPPLTYAILAAIATFLIWWFPAGQRILPVSPYDVIVSVGILVFLASMCVAWWRRAVGILRIGIDGAEEPITVRLVSTNKAEHVFNALKG